MRTLSHSHSLNFSGGIPSSAKYHHTLVVDGQLCTNEGMRFMKNGSKADVNVSLCNFFVYEHKTLQLFAALCGDDR